MSKRIGLKVAKLRLKNPSKIAKLSRFGRGSVKVHGLAIGKRKKWTSGRNDKLVKQLPRKKERKKEVSRSRQRLLAT